MTTDRRFLLIHADAWSLRRRLGPTAWVVLEELLARSIGAQPSSEALATTRTLAGDLGISKDTVAHALARLRCAGLVEPAQDRTPAGTFTAGRYLIAVPGCITVLDATADRSPVPVRSADPKPGATRPNGSQLPLSLND